MEDDSKTDIEAKRELHRKMATNKLIQTEQKYVSRLETLNKIYVEPLDNYKNMVLPYDDHIKLFPKILQNIIELNKRILIDITCPKSSIGKAMEHFLPSLKIYQTYLNDYDSINELMLKLRRNKNSYFCKYLYKQEKNDQGYTIESYLIEPIQRIGRYELLFNEIFRFTDTTHQDYKHLQECVEKLSQGNRSMNKKIAEYEQRHKVFLIETRIINVDIKDKYASSTNLFSSWFGGGGSGKDNKLERVRLVTPSRKFIKQGQMTKVSRKGDIRYMFYLFNDLLLYCSEGMNNMLIMHERINLTDPYFHVKECKTDNDYSAYKAFEIHSIEKSFIAYAGTRKETVRWYNAIQSCLEAIRDSGNLKILEIDVTSPSSESQSDMSKQIRILHTAPLWVPRKDNTTCMVSNCGKQFMTWIRPSHYCNYCGKTVCYECFRNKLLHYKPEKRMKGVKVGVCNECFRKYSKKVRKASRSESSLLDIKSDSEDFESSDESDEDETEAFLCYQKLINLGFDDEIAMEACKQYSDINDALNYIRNNYKDEEKKLSMIDFDELMSSKYRTVEFDVFVAIDFGTHGTGLGYAVKNKKTDDWGNTQAEYTTFMEQDWVGAGGTSTGEIKNKTDILLTCNGKFIAFGYAALNRYKGEEDEESDYDDDDDDEELKDDSKKMAERDMLFESFKMSLYKTEGKDKGDIKEMIPCKDGRLLPTEIVFIEALKFIKRSVFKTFQKNELNIQNKDSDLERIQWILTVPAIWSDRAKYKMELWAQKAGLTKKDIKDHIRIVYEPDCASISCQYEQNSKAQLTESKPFEKGEKYILIDAGGGTVDIACHMVIDEDQMQEVYHPTGGPWGSDYVDVYFQKFLGELFGDDNIDEYIHKYPHDWTKILDEFRSAKMIFYKEEKPFHATQLTFEFTLNFDLPKITKMRPFGLAEGSVYAIEDKIFISTEIWQQHLFDQVMNPMIEHIEDLLNNKVDGIKYICICGGLSISKYFQAKMHASFGKDSKYKLAIRTPRKPILSVIDGAVKLATRPNYISGRKLRKSYGIAVDRLLQDVDQSKLPKDYLNTHLSNGTVSGLFSKFVSKNTLVKSGEYLEKTYNRGSLTEKKKIIKIYSSDLRNPYVVEGEPLAELPIHFKRNYNDLNFKIKLNFGTTKIRVFAMNEEIEVNYKFYNATKYVEMKAPPQPEIDDIRLNQKDCKMEIICKFASDEKDYRYDDLNVKAWFEVDINDENYQVGTKYETLPIIIENLSVGIDYGIKVKCINDKCESISKQFNKKPILFTRKPPMPKILKRQALDSKIFIKFGCDYNFNENDEKCRPKYEIKILGKKYNQPNIITIEKQKMIEFLTNGIDYKLKIRATNKFGNSKWTKWILLTPLKQPYKPSDLLTVCGAKSITLYWISLDNMAEDYINGVFKIITEPETSELYSKPNKETKKTKLKIEFKQQHRLAIGIQFKFKVFAINRNFQIESDWSEPAVCLNINKTKVEYSNEKMKMMENIYGLHREKAEILRKQKQNDEQKVEDKRRMINLKRMQTKVKVKTNINKIINDDDDDDKKIELSLDCELGKLLLNELPMEGIIKYEKENTFWMIQLGEKWQNNKQKFVELCQKLYCNEIWYKNGIERGKKWANKINVGNENNIKIIPPTAISGLHITLKRIDINDKNKPQCFVDGNIVKFKIKRLVCFPPFRKNPKNLPGQEMDNNGCKWYATYWWAVEIQFVDEFQYKTQYTPHVSICNIAVKLKADDVEKLDDSK